MREDILVELNQANQLRDAGKTAEAIAIFEKYLNDPDVEIAIGANNGLGIAYLNEEKFEEAAECYTRADQLARTHNLPEKRIGITRDRAINLKNWGKHAEAEKVFHEAIALTQEILPDGAEKNAILGITHNKLGLNYLDAGDFTQAQTSIEEGIELLEKGNNPYWTLIAKIDYARLLNTIREYAKAQALLDTLIEEATKQGKSYKLAEALISAGDSAIGLQEKDKARTYIEQAENIIDSFDSPSVKDRITQEIQKRLILLAVIGTLFTLPHLIQPVYAPALQPPVSAIIS